LPFNPRRKLKAPARLVELKGYVTRCREKVRSRFILEGAHETGAYPEQGGFVFGLGDIRIARTDQAGLK
jgi:hypothetical protein